MSVSVSLDYAWLLSGVTPSHEGWRQLFSGMDWAGGALCLAGTAVNAGVGVNLVVLSALRDWLGGAYSGASSAWDASVGDYVSHCSLN